jgi:hypothetical protein
VRASRSIGGGGGGARPPHPPLAVAYGTLPHSKECRLAHCVALLLRGGSVLSLLLQGKGLATQALAFMNKLESCFAATGEFSDEIYNAFEEVPLLIQEFFTRRIQLYERTCADGAAVAQMRAILIALDRTYRKLYDPIFDQQVIADQEGFIAFQEYANAKQLKLSQRITACVQSATKIEMMYVRACVCMLVVCSAVH